jgi:hypothetical protein
VKERKDWWRLERLNRIADTLLKFGAIWAAVVAFPLLLNRPDVTWTLEPSNVVDTKRVESEYQRAEVELPQELVRIASRYRGNREFQIIEDPPSLGVFERGPGAFSSVKFYGLSPSDVPLLAEALGEGHHPLYVYPLLSSLGSDRAKEFRFAVKAFSQSIVRRYFLEVRNEGSARAEDVRPEGPASVGVTRPEDERFNLDPGTHRTVTFVPVESERAEAVELIASDFAVDAPKRGEPKYWLLVAGVVLITLGVIATSWWDWRRGYS